MKRWFTLFGVLGALSLGTSALAATVTLPDTSQTTTLTATVSEQARIVVPAGITFSVNDISASTAASAATITIDNIVLATATKQLQLSVEANAASFTPPVSGATTWDAADVTWNAASWTGGSGSAGTLSNSAFNTVSTGTADTAALSTTALVFTLGPKTTVKRSGSHTLAITWKVASIGT